MSYQDEYALMLAKQQELEATKGMIHFQGEVTNGDRIHIMTVVREQIKTGKVETRDAKPELNL